MPVWCVYILYRGGREARVGRHCLGAIAGAAGMMWDIICPQSRVCATTPAHGAASNKTLGMLPHALSVVMAIEQLALAASWLIYGSCVGVFGPAVKWCTVTAPRHFNGSLTWFGLSAAEKPIVNAKGDTRCATHDSLPPHDTASTSSPSSHTPTLGLKKKKSKKRAKFVPDPRLYANPEAADSTAATIMAVVEGVVEGLCGLPSAVFGCLAFVYSFAESCLNDLCCFAKAVWLLMSRPSPKTKMVKADKEGEYVIEIPLLLEGTEAVLVLVIVVMTFVSAACVLIPPSLPLLLLLVGVIWLLPSNKTSMSPQQDDSNAVYHDADDAVYHDAQEGNSDEGSDWWKLAHRGVDVRTRRQVVHRHRTTALQEARRVVRSVCGRAAEAHRQRKGRRPRPTTDTPTLPPRMKKGRKRPKFEPDKKLHSISEEAPETITPIVSAKATPAAPPTTWHPPRKFLRTKQYPSDVVFYATDWRNPFEYCVGIGLYGRVFKGIVDGRESILVEQLWEDGFENELKTYPKVASCYSAFFNKYQHNFYQLHRADSCTELIAAQSCYRAFCKKYQHKYRCSSPLQRRRRPAAAMGSY
ncbi:unnamed protein product [Vitrella brassicaformis CCMP3155]|uniref:Uncharacterized protein n=1 Tax=Vitrella brassicaformis (strain CCMP3155) TaxID=1169540 RepID=A0A0G4H0P4_VITBC|nr:unnamed protein product [Vitrella brassicaformis CCMP3155]|eukprot:CEM37142.1 unnamed protein product [Vitrella brassicaformis CCMP3155]